MWARVPRSKPSKSHDLFSQIYLSSFIGQSWLSAINKRDQNTIIPEASTYSPTLSFFRGLISISSCSRALLREKSISTDQREKSDSLKNCKRMDKANMFCSLIYA